MPPRHTGLVLDQVPLLVNVIDTYSGLLCAAMLLLVGCGLAFKPVALWRFFQQEADRDNKDLDIRDHARAFRLLGVAIALTGLGVALGWVFST